VRFEQEIRPIDVSTQPLTYLSTAIAAQIRALW